MAQKAEKEHSFAVAGSPKKSVFARLISYPLSFITAAAITLLSWGSIGCSTYNITMSQPARVAATEPAFAERDLRDAASTAWKVICGDGGQGSGVLVSDRYVLTDAHVVFSGDVDNSGDFSLFTDGHVERQDNENLVVREYKVVMADLLSDLALLKLDVPVFSRRAKVVETPDATALRLFQKVAVIGFPLGVTDANLTEGRITDLWSDGFIRYSAWSYFGNSGGPVFAEVGGELAVISLAQRLRIDRYGIPIGELSFGVHPEKLRAFLNCSVTEEAQEAFANKVKEDQEKRDNVQPEPDPEDVE